MTVPSSIQIPQQQPQSQQTTPTQSQPAQQPPVSKEAAAAVRKRRRRAPAGGATDDCFTCSKRNVKCDRRRPYCSQCLEVGNDCSGYKTQLTWGVGVASRGKLRGLSLPIAKAPPVAGSVKKASISRARTNSTATTTSTWSDTDEASRRLDRGSVDLSPEHIQAVITSATYLARSCGGTIGVTVGSAVYQNILKANLWARFGDYPHAAEIIARIRDDLDELHRLPPGWKQGVVESFMGAFRGVWLTMLGLSILALICISLMRQHTLHATLERR
ncbi:hypothetical protein BN1723_006323 [Verticillium longisporum]|uniref:Zn(2)-C6 fungal-type domain-containing protein n=1 Tax=Verticillium longisporum TaxID=100787 RepID=A0A0G4NEE1_VERLO|nr:hypothetical protein BN1723_006323 [Verticillium longisporum]